MPYQLNMILIKLIVVILTLINFFSFLYNSNIKTSFNEKENTYPSLYLLTVFWFGYSF